MPERIGFIGLGLMGKPMALNLLKRGFSVVAHSRSVPPVEEVVRAGAARAESPADVARQCSRLITMVPDSRDVEAVLEGPAGVFEGMNPGTILIDMSTISPIVTRRLADAARARGATLLDAPVSGGEIGAVNATLSIMVGGDEAAFNEVLPILRALGNPERIIRIGDSGAGQVCKVCNQMVIGGTLAAVSEAIALARKAGVDAARVREALLGGFAASRVLEVHGERILSGNYKPGFRARLYAKDYRIAAETLAANHCPAPVSSVVKNLVDALASARPDDDYSALATVIFGMADLP
jgi:2-hydroxy-3-oxopropionate reductase